MYLTLFCWVLIASSLALFIQLLQLRLEVMIVCFSWLSDGVGRALRVLQMYVWNARGGSLTEEIGSSQIFCAVLRDDEPKNHDRATRHCRRCCHCCCYCWHHYCSDCSMLAVFVDIRVGCRSKDAASVCSRATVDYDNNKHG
jgi:hypothetical protein